MSKAVVEKPSLNSKRRRQTLRKKLFLPFLIILIIFGAATIYGSLRLMHSSLTQSTDERLQATQEILYREFKKQETILQTYAVFLQHFQSMSSQFEGTDEIGILQDKLFNTLEESNISVSFYPIEMAELLPTKILVDLFDQVKRSNQPRFRYSNDLGDLPLLMVAAPLYEAGKIKKIILLSTAMGDTFLNKLTAPLEIRATLLDLDGDILAQSHTDHAPMQLSPAQISSVGRGERLYLNYDDPTEGIERHQISAIPLGTTDIIFLSLETSQKSSSSAQQSLLIQLLLIIFAALLIGTIVYFRIISNIVRPAKELELAAERISEGHFNHRITDIRSDELGNIAEAFNRMVGNLEINYQQRAAKDISKVLDDEAAKNRGLLRRKDQEIDKVNEDFHHLQREMGAFYQLNQAMISASDLPILFDRILQVINETLNCDHLVLLLYNPGDSSLQVVKTAGIDFENLKEVRFTFDQGITGEAAQSQRLIYIKDLAKETRSLSYHGAIVTRGSMVSVPLVVKGRLLGVMNLHKKELDSISSSELKLIQAVANQTAIAIDNSQLLEKARDLSNTDELTGLSNRRYFQEILKREVAQARRFASNFSIIMSDIDHFKAINDKHGRMRADTVLRQMAQCLLKNTRGIDLVCRFGTEQFVVLLPKTDKKGAVSAAEKLRKCILNEKFDLGKEKETQVSMSFGVTEFPIDSKNIYELLNLADRALYAAKNEGRNRTVAWEGPPPGPE